MRDERYVFVSDVKERKSAARSARNRRTHNGKGGRAILPHDHMTRKEWESMNGEVKTYKLNEPMSYAEFKAMPDDIKKTYIKVLRSRFGVPDKYIAEMMGAGKSTMAYCLSKLGISNGNTNSKLPWNRDGWNAWIEGISVLPEEAVEETLGEAACDVEDEEAAVEQAEDSCEKTRVVPRSGSLEFEGSAAEVFAAAAALLGDRSFVIQITWVEQEG